MTMFILKVFEVPSRLLGNFFALNDGFGNANCKHKMLLNSPICTSFIVEREKSLTVIIFVGV